MKAELAITDAQERLWEVFAEALRDFLKAGSRPRIKSSAGATSLPERLAIQERDLASDLESLRQWKAIVETFYAGLSEEQRRGADHLLRQLFGAPWAGVPRGRARQGPAKSWEWAVRSRRSISFIGSKPSAKAKSVFPNRLWHTSAN
jgi:hypothetical protein